MFNIDKQKAVSFMLYVARDIVPLLAVSVDAIIVHVSTGAHNRCVSHALNIEWLIIMYAQY